MTNAKKITATFFRKNYHDSGRDQAPDYYIYEFTNIVDDNGKKYSDSWIKETKLMQAVTFQKGKNYQITLSDKPYEDAVNLPYPVEIAWDNERVYRKGGNAIIRVAKDGGEENLSTSIATIMGVKRSHTIAYNKFTKGQMTVELLKKMNSLGIFFYAHYYDPQDKRKNGSGGVGYIKNGNQNYILIQKETQKEINSDLKSIKEKYVTKAIEKYFKVTTELLPPKKRKK